MGYPNAAQPLTLKPTASIGECPSGSQGVEAQGAQAGRRAECPVQPSSLPDLCRGDQPLAQTPWWMGRRMGTLLCPSGTENNMSQGHLCKVWGKWSRCDHHKEKSGSICVQKISPLKNLSQTEGTSLEKRSSREDWGFYFHEKRYWNIRGYQKREIINGNLYRKQTEPQWVWGVFNASSNLARNASRSGCLCQKKRQIYPGFLFKICSLYHHKTKFHF